jgi:dTDP-4-amino-4,6-dideoxygalactose transaminase
VRDGATHVWHLYVIRAQRRDELKGFLAQRGIETAVHYPTALPLLPAYKYLGYQPSQVPRAAANQTAILSLPMFPEMSDAMIGHVAASLREFYASR